MPNTLAPAPPAGEAAQLRAQLAVAQARIFELERLADSDPLTGLPNRRPFMRAIDRAIRQFDRHGTPAAVMFIDVDGLKAINDGGGHAAGDAALLQVAATLREEVRGSDTVARIGGDEFGLVLDHLNEEAAHTKKALLGDAVGEATMVRLSIGVATIRAEDKVEAVLGRADADMYRMKRAQRSDK